MAKLTELELAQRMKTAALKASDGGWVNGRRFVALMTRLTADSSLRILRGQTRQQIVSSSNLATPLTFWRW